MGVVSIPFALGVSVLVLRLRDPLLHFPVGGSDKAVAILGILFFLMTSSVAYVASMIGRPARVSLRMMMDTFNQNLLEIEQIVSGKLRRQGREA